jgi:hypothetical protein
MSNRAIRLEMCAAAAHEANRFYCEATGDASQVPWQQAPEWQRNSALAGVAGVLAGNGPRESHACWLAEKERSGWTFGPVKDPEKKQHPCMVPYDDLPDARKVKDRIFVNVVRVMASALFLEIAASNA